MKLKFRFFLLYSIFFLFTLTTAGINTRSLQTLNPIGVTEGTSVNYEIVKNDLDLSAITDAGLSQSAFDWSVVGLEDFDFAVIDSQTQDIVLPALGDIFVVNLTKLPSLDPTVDLNGLTVDNPSELVSTLVDNAGEMSIKLKNATQTVPAPFLIGTPFTFKLWDLWSSALMGLEDVNDNQTQITLAVSTINVGDYFNSTIDIDFNMTGIPTNLISSISLVQSMSYEKATGIQEFMSVALTTVADVIGASTLEYKIVRTTEEPTEVSSSSSQSEGSSTPGFELLSVVLLGSIIIITRKSNKR